MLGSNILFLFLASTVPSCLAQTGTGTGGGNNNNNDWMTEFENCFFVGDIKGAGKPKSVAVYDGVLNPGACQELCWATAGCGWFSWSSVEQTCKLRWGRVVEVDLSDGKNQTDVSGPRSCVGCFISGQGYAPESGCIADLDDVASATDCQLQCALHPECVSFTFYPLQCRCQLNARNSELTVNTEAISGPKLCQTCDCTADE